MSRWSSPRVYPCNHGDCPHQAVILSPGCTDVPGAHNCCRRHVDPVVHAEYCSVLAGWGTCDCEADS